MKRRLLAWLKVSELPEPPPGSTAGLRTFRPSRRYFYYTAVLWLPKQVGTFVGLLFSLAFFGTFDRPERDFVRAEGWDRFLERLEGLRFHLGPFEADPTVLFTFFEALAIGAFVAQFLFTGLLLKLSWEMRWYMVGDEALRIRDGLWRLREQTMTIANIQNMSIRQGPLQKLFGIADLEIHTAGGGGKAKGSDGSGSEGHDHVGRFRGLEDAEELREHIRSRLVRHRGAGLGDAEDDAEPAPASPAGAVSTQALEVARALLAEARALRREASARGL